MTQTKCAEPTRGSYSQGCRCWGCRQANSEYEYNRSNGLIESQFMSPSYTTYVRSMVNKTIKSGMSKRELCRLAEVSRSTLNALLVSHHRTGKPVKRIKADVGRRLVSVAKQIQAQGDSVRAPLDKTLVASDTWVRTVDRWVAHGLSVRQIARITGIGASTLYDRHKRELVTQLTVERLDWAKNDLARAVLSRQTRDRRQG